MASVGSTSICGGAGVAAPREHSMGFGIVHTSAAQSRIVKWDSAA
jgi:hypothetical protein